MLKKDYYQVLNLAPNCTPQEVKKNYHKLALKWHPDKHINKSEAEGRFTEINEAYTILGDAKKREIYDTCGHQGLIIEQELRDFTSCNKRDFFCQKNFQGTNKSAFEVLRDIFEENDDDDEDDLFGNFNPFDMTDDFRSNIKSFIDDTLMSSENEDGDSFFKKYTPTFMDSSFFGTPPLFTSKSSQNECNSHSEFFSFFSTMDSDIQSFSRTSTTIRNKGKVRTSTKQRVQQGGKVFENEETFEYIESILNPPHSVGKDLNCKRPCKYKHEKPDVVIIEDDDIKCFDKVNIRTQNKKKPGNLKMDNSNGSRKGKNNCKIFELSDMADDECDIFTGSGIKFTNGCCKKNKK